MALSRPASAPALEQTGLRRSPSQTQVVLIHSSKKYNVRPTSAAVLRTTATMPSLLAHSPLRAKLPPPPRRIGAWPDGWPKKAGGALPSRDELKAASERLVNPLGRQKLSREERQQRTAERLAKQPVPTDVYGGGRRAGARAQPV